MNVRHIAAAFAVAALPFVATATSAAEQPTVKPDLREQSVKAGTPATPKQRAKAAKAQNKQARASMRDKTARDRTAKHEKQDQLEKNRKASAT